MLSAGGTPTVEADNWFLLLAQGLMSSECSSVMLVGPQELPGEARKVSHMIFNTDRFSLLVRNFKRVLLSGLTLEPIYMKGSAYVVHNLMQQLVVTSASWRATLCFLLGEELSPG